MEVQSSDLETASNETQLIEESTQNNENIEMDTVITEEVIGSKREFKPDLNEANSAIHVPYILNGELYEIQDRNGENVTVKCIHCPTDRLYRGSVRSTGNFHMHIKRRHPNLLEKLHGMRVKALLAQRSNQLNPRDKHHHQKGYKRTAAAVNLKVPVKINLPYPKLKTALKQRHQQQQQQLQLEQQQQQQQNLCVGSANVKNGKSPERKNSINRTSKENVHKKCYKGYNRFANALNHQQSRIFFSSSLIANEPTQKLFALTSSPSISYIKSEDSGILESPLNLSTKNKTYQCITGTLSVDNSVNTPNKSATPNKTTNLIDFYEPISNDCPTNEIYGVPEKITENSTLKELFSSLKSTLQDIKDEIRYKNLIEIAKFKHLNPTFNFDLQ